MHTTSYMSVIMELYHTKGHTNNPLNKCPKRGLMTTCGQIPIEKHYHSLVRPSHSLLDTFVNFWLGYIRNIGSCPSRGATDSLFPWLWISHPFPNQYCTLNAHGFSLNIPNWSTKLPFLAAMATNLVSMLKGTQQSFCHPTLDLYLKIPCSEVIYLSHEKVFWSP